MRNSRCGGLPGKMLGLAAAVTLAAATMAALSPAAQAATSPAATASQTTLTVPAGATVTSTAGGGRVRVVGSPTTTATCTLTVFTPNRYYGGPYGGGEQGPAEIQCSTSVTQLFIEVALFLNGNQVTYNSNNSYSSNLVSVVTYYPVQAGNYFTGADGTEYASGSTIAVPYKQSPTVYLT